MVRLSPTMSELEALWKHCGRFIEDQRISCPETISQTDRVIENAYEFIEGIGEIVGYHSEPE